MSGTTSANTHNGRIFEFNLVPSNRLSYNSSSNILLLAPEKKNIFDTIQVRVQKPRLKPKRRPQKVQQPQVQKQQRAPW